MIKKIYFTLVLFLLIFNPYTIYGKPGMVLGFLYLGYSVCTKSYKIFNTDNVLIFLLIFLISLWAVYISLINNIFQINFLYSSSSFVFFIIASAGVVRHAIKNSICIESFLFFILVAIIFNSLIVVFEAFFPMFKGFIESHLAPAGNIEWANSFRIRGLAASGGSGLSIVAPLGVILALYLFSIRYIGFLFLFSTVILMISSLFFIGRTGLIFIPLAVFSFFLASFFYNKNLIYKFVLLLPYFIVLLIALGFVFIFFYDLLLNTYGTDFVEYSFGFIFDGAEGFKREGTVSILIEFMQVLPLDFPAFFIGMGFYGGSELDPWTDAGYARVFLSVGFILGLFFYFCILYFYIINSKGFHLVTFPIIFVLLLSEIKGSFLFSEFASRVMILLTVFILFKNNYYSNGK